jgi:hypothetical protein
MALAGIGLLWLAFQLGLLKMLADAIIAPLAPTGPTNAGEVYREIEAERAIEESGPSDST